MNLRYKLVLSIAIILLSSLLPYLNTLQGDLVHDDKFAIVENPDILNNLNIINIFSNDFWGTPILNPKSHKSYRPLTILSFKLNHYLHGLSPYGYHLFNILIHSLNSLMLFIISYWYIFQDNITLSLYTACLFASHPIHTEAVAGVVGRAELLACFTFLITLLLYHHLCISTNSSTQINYCSHIFVLLLVGVVTGIATLCKENGITILGVCGVIDLTIYSRNNVRTAGAFLYKLEYSNAFKCCKLFLMRSLFLFITLVLILFLRILIQGGELPKFLDEDNPASFSTPLTKFLSYNYIYFVNVFLLLMPSRLSYDWQMGSIPLLQEITDERNICSLTLWVMILCVLFKLSYYWIKSSDVCYKPILYSLVLLIVPFLPSSNLFLRVGFVLAERVLYIPSISLCICIPAGFNLLFNKFKIPRLCSLSLCLIVILFSLKTYQRNKVWLSRESLFISGIRDMPNNAKMHYNYANFLKDNLQTPEAILHYKSAVALWPSHASSHNNLGTLLEGEEAIHHFRSAIAAKPTHSRAMYNLGNRLAKEYKYSEAIDTYYSSLRVDNSSSDCWLSLTAALIKTQASVNEINFSLQNAESTATRSLSNWLNLAQMYLDVGNLSKAEVYFTKCIEEIASILKDGTENCYLGLATVYRRNNELVKAERWYEQALQLFPDFNLAYTTYGSFQFNIHNYKRAVELYRIAFNTFPIQTEENISNFVQMLLKNGLINEARSLIHKHFNSNTQSVILLKLFIQIEMADKKDLYAIELLTNYSSIVENNEDLLYFKAIALRNIGNYTEALHVYQSILLTDANNSRVLHDIGVIYHILKKYKESLFYYERALDLTPGDPLIMQNIQKVKKFIP
ncbi:Transmembrane and TPR repeat-containing protein 1 [Oopsacas minuta]|uniref:dolichyl-phosphate-mannose--protein mannosyltransferase n=1 Tax=Oopsacas minuta TaxID=111878 RepID=A0AAV7JBB3_9METZ|nr:Transmembrane and TPR repeat-containing protein 1 [Oopsacas minuta]